MNARDENEKNTNPISPLPNVTPDFQKGEKKNKFSKLLIFSTDCSQSTGLQSVPKIRAKTLKLFALQASPHKGSKPRVNLDRFDFSRSCRSFLYGESLNLYSDGHKNSILTTWITVAQQF